MQTSLPSRHSQCESLYTQKSDPQQVAFVRIKGLEPPRLSASDPKSDVATNYTISAGSILLNLRQEGSPVVPIGRGLRCKGKNFFCNIHNIITLFRIIFPIFVF